MTNAATTNHDASARRVLAALQHRESDRVPLDVGGTRVTGIHEAAYRRFREHMTLPPTRPPWKIRYLMLSHLDRDFRDRIATDIVSVDPDTACLETDREQTADGWQYRDMWSSDWFMPNGGSYYDVRSFPLENAETLADVRAYPWPRGDEPCLFSSMEETAARIRFKEGRAVVLGRTCPGVFEMLHILCGHEKAFMDMAINPKLSEAIMEHVLEHKLEYYTKAIEQLDSAGIDYFLVSESDDLGAQNGLVIGRDMYKKLVKPRHAEMFRRIKTLSAGRAFVELHCCGSIRELIPDLIDAGVEVLNPVQVSAAGMEDTAQLKAEFGEHIVFHGAGVDSQKTLPYGTPQEVADEVRRRINDLAPGGGFIFTPVHSIQHDVPYENFAAMLQSYHEYAPYVQR